MKKEQREILEGMLKEAIFTILDDLEKVKNDHVDLEKLKEILTTHEGLKLKPYKCPAGKDTVGIGRNLTDKGITKDEALYLLENDIYEVINDLLRLFSRFDDFTENRKLALCDMRFQLGPNRFRNFKKMIAAIHGRDWDEAANQAKDSRYFKQVPVRAQWVVDMLREG